MLRAQLVDSTSALVFAVTQQYAEAIPGMQAVHLTDAAGADATLAFILIAALYALLCSWTVMRSESLVYLLVFDTGSGAVPDHSADASGGWAICSL